MLHHRQRPQRRRQHRPIVEVPDLHLTPGQRHVDPLAARVHLEGRERPQQAREVRDAEIFHAVADVGQQGGSQGDRRRVVKQGAGMQGLDKHEGFAGP